MARQPACPQCAKPTSLAASNPWRPFCCERCRLIDLGEWLSEERRIPGREIAEPSSESDLE